MIRHATPEDLDAIVAMGLAFLTAVYSEKLTAPPDPARLHRTARWLLEDAGDRALFVSERDGALTGMFGLHCYPHPFTGQRMASEMFWWVNPDRRGRWDGIRLFATAREWAQAHGAAVLHMVAPNAEIEQLYTRLGYQHVESAFAAQL